MTHYDSPALCRAVPPGIFYRNYNYCACTHRIARNSIQESYPILKPYCEKTLSFENEDVATKKIEQPRRFSRTEPCFAASEVKHC